MIRIPTGTSKLLIDVLAFPPRIALAPVIFNLPVPVMVNHEEVLTSLAAVWVFPLVSSDALPPPFWIVNVPLTVGAPLNEMTPV